MDLLVDVAKGYYVRSLARDLGERLGVPAHLAGLRRSSSGAFAQEESVALDAGPVALRAALIPIATAVTRALPAGRLTAEGVVRVRQGKLVQPGDFAELPPACDASAWIDPGRPAGGDRRAARGRVCYGSGDDRGRVRDSPRGFVA